MAEAPAQIELEPEDPLEILRSGLIQEQVAATEETAIRIADSGRNMVVNEGQAQTQRTGFADSAYDAIVANARSTSNTRVITNKDVQNVLYDPSVGGRYIGTLPAGAKVIGPNAVTKKLPDGSVEVFVKQTTPEVPPAKVFQAQQEAYSRPQGAVFNLENEEEKLKTYTGEERLNAITTLLSNLGAEMTKRRQAIGSQAAIQSGYTSAQVALDRALQTEMLPNPQFGGLSFQQRFGVASAQTVQAQELMRTAQITMDQLEKSMLQKDAEFSKYAYAQDRLMKIETRMAMTQVRKEERAEDRIVRKEDRVEEAATRRRERNEDIEARRHEIALETIPQHQTAAYQVLHPGTTAEEANTQLMQARRNNPTEFLATQTTPQNIYDNLTHPELAVRQTTLEVMKAHDKANNAGYANADKTPTSELIRPFVANPSLLEQKAVQMGLATKEEIATVTTQIAGAEPKRKASLRQEQQALLLRRFIEKTIDASYVNDMRSWKSTETGTGTHLASVIASVSKSNTSGKADMPTVIEKFVTDPTFTNTDGSTMPYEQRLQMLLSGLSGAIGNEFKTMLYPDMSDVHNKLATQITNAAARARIKILTPSLMSSEMGMAYGANQ